MKRALVTGGSSSIGAAICRRLALKGLHVVIHAHGSPGRAQALMESLLSEGLSAETAIFDLCDFAATAQALEPVLAAGAPQVVVHNAGVHDDVPLAGMSGEQWRSVIDVSLNGFFAVLRPLILPLIGTRWGRVIAVSSVSAVMGNRGQVNYAAAKAGLHGAVKSLAREVASRNVTVNAVAPGIIASPAVSAAIDSAQIAATVPAKRAGTPEEVADLVAFLASDQASYINGQIISINGGMA